MFDNVGKKIKTVTQIACWVCIIAFVILGIALIVSGNQLNSEYMSKGQGNTTIVAGVIVLVIGPLLSWLISLVFYALGQITEDSHIRTQLAWQTVKAATKDNVDSTQHSNTGFRETNVIAEKPEESVRLPKECKPIKVDENHEKCQLCGAVQISGQFSCIECGAHFIHTTQKSEIRECKAVPVEGNKERCELCGTVQNQGRDICWECGAKFIR